MHIVHFEKVFFGTKKSAGKLASSFCLVGGELSPKDFFSDCDRGV